MVHYHYSIDPTKQSVFNPSMIKKNRIVRLCGENDGYKGGDKWKGEEWEKKSDETASPSQPVALSRIPAVPPPPISSQNPPYIDHTHEDPPPIQRGLRNTCKHDRTHPAVALSSPTWALCILCVSSVPSRQCHHWQTVRKPPPSPAQCSRPQGLSRSALSPTLDSPRTNTRK